jgi:hypothetical protein
MNVEQRQQIEREIVQCAVTDLIACGYAITVGDGESYPIKRSRDVLAVMRELFATDEEVLYVVRGNGSVMGHVLLVYGNDGYDVIADYTMSLEADLAGANALAERISEQHP